MTKQTKRIAIAFAGQGPIPKNAVESLLNDWLGFGPVDEDGFYTPSEHEIQLFFPVSQDHWNDELNKVCDWSGMADLSYTAVLAKGERGEEFETVISDAAETIEASNVSKALVDALHEATADEKYIVLLWGAEGDEDSENILTLAEIRDIPAKDLTNGLDDLSFTEEEEEEPEAAPEPEPERPTRGSRRRGKPEEKAEEKPEPAPEQEAETAEVPLEDAPAKPARKPRVPKEVKAFAGNAAISEVVEPEATADTNPNPSGDWGGEKAPEPTTVPLDLVTTIAALQASQSYFRAIDLSNARKNLSDEVQPSPITRLIAEGLQEALTAHGRLRVPAQGAEAVSEAQDAPEVPKRGRGRPRTKEEVVAYLKNDAEGTYRKAGRGRPRRGETRVELTAADVADYEGKGLIEDED